MPTNETKQDAQMLPGHVASTVGLGQVPERSDEWTAAVWDSWCDMPREGQNLKLHDLLLYGEACYAKAVAAERDRIKERLLGMDDATSHHNYYAHAAWVLF